MAKAKTNKETGPKLTYVDLPELGETFADSVEEFFFDGVTFRCTFSVTRFDTPKPPAPPTGRKYPTCRLVLTAEAAQDLHMKLTNLAAAIEQSRKANQAQQGPKTVQ